MKPTSAETTMHNTDIIDEIIRQIDPERIPSEYIIMAKICLADGREAIVPGDELEQMMEKYGDEVQDVRVILDVRKIRLAIIEKTNQIFAEVNAI